MLILITWKLSHISEFTRVYSPHKEYACIVFYANLSWFRFQWVCADARKMFAHANERVNILASFGGMGARVEKDTGSGDEENYHYFSRKIFFFNLMRALSEIIFIQTGTHVWLTWHFICSQCVFLWRNFYILQIPLFSHMILLLYF